MIFHSAIASGVSARVISEAAFERDVAAMRNGSEALYGLHQHVDDSAAVVSPRHIRCVSEGRFL
jgi:hypothetical protein